MKKILLLLFIATSVFAQEGYTGSDLNFLTKGALRDSLDRRSNPYLGSDGVVTIGIIPTQSNAVGMGGNGGDGAINPLIQHWSDSTMSWLTTDLSTEDPDSLVCTGHYANFSHFPFSFARRLVDEYGDTVKMIFAGKGGLSIQEFIPETDVYFLEFTNKVTNSSTTEIDIIIGHQGESNQNMAFREYADSLQLVINQLRALPQITDKTPIVLGEMRENGVSNGLNPFYANIHSYIPDPYLVVANTKYFPSHPAGDGHHFNGESLVEIGYERYYAALRTIPHANKNIALTADSLGTKGYYSGDLFTVEQTLSTSGFSITGTIDSTINMWVNGNGDYVTSGAKDYYLYPSGNIYSFSDYFNIKQQSASHAFKLSGYDAMSDSNANMWVNGSGDFKITNTRDLSIDPNRDYYLYTRHAIIQFDGTAGYNELKFKDGNASIVGTIDDDGNARFDGTLGVGTDSPDEKFEVEFDTDKDVEIGVGTTDTDITFITLRSPNGTKYYVTVDDSGNFTSSTSKP